MGFPGFFSLLHNLKEDGTPHRQAGTHGQFFGKPFRHQVLGQGSRREGKTGLFFSLPDILGTKKTHFPLRHAPVGISLNPAGKEKDPLHLCFRLLPFRAHANGPH